MQTSLSSSQSVIVCSTARLARHLQLAQQRAHLQQGETQWQPSLVFTLADWLQSIIETALLAGEIPTEGTPLGELTSFQESLLWEQSIAHALKHHAASDLFDTSGLASAAMEAHRLLIEWNLSVDSTHASEETQQFLVWRQRFLSLTKQTGFLESVRYRAWQLACLERGAGSLPNEVKLAGFDRQHPHLKHLIEILRARGVSVSEQVLTFDQPQQVWHLPLADQDAECRAAVAWVKALLAQQPDARVAIVVPALETLRAKLANLLDDTFHPETAAPAHAEHQRCYDFSLGVPLSTVPIINTALRLLRFAWQRGTLTQAEFASLLHDPYWSDALREANARAKLGGMMRRDLPMNITVATCHAYVAQVLDGEHKLAVQRLHADMQAMLLHVKQSERQQTPAQWKSAFEACLSATHWQGERALSSHEYQAVQAFEGVLQQLAQLERFVGKISAEEAIQRITQLCKAQIFQPENKRVASIQVMGLMEATAEPLDAIWVMGMNDHVWPPVARPNALIPAECQRHAGTPNASCEVQNAFAQAVHQRLIRSGRHIVFSSALKEGERALRTSPLMQGLPASPHTQANMVATLAEQLSGAERAWQWLDDHQAPPVLVGEHVSGGTGLLKAQAICPAWAFYQYRLFARKLETPVNGLDAAERGALVHAVLAWFWQHHTFHNVMQLPQEQLADAVRTAVDAALADYASKFPNKCSEAFLALEAERLRKLVQAWLNDVDLVRPVPFVVEACEQTHRIDIEGIQIKLVIDRVDRLDDGRLCVIDYKTSSQVDYKNWAQASITEPQLPIYAAFVLADQTVAAVCFAKVNLSTPAFAGIAAEENLMQGAQVLTGNAGRKIFPEADFPTWQSIIQHWDASIRQTARAVKAGDAAVKFEHEKQLTYCDVLPMLRLPERLLQFERVNSVRDLSTHTQGEPT